MAICTSAAARAPTRSTFSTSEASDGTCTVENNAGAMGGNNPGGTLDTLMEELSRYEGSAVAIASSDPNTPDEFISLDTITVDAPPAAGEPETTGAPESTETSGPDDGGMTSSEGASATAQRVRRTS